MLLNTDLKIRNKINYDKDINKHDSFVLKKSSGDCLKLAKQWYSIWVKWRYFWTTALSQVVQKH